MTRYFTVNGTLTNELGSAFKAVYSSGDVIVYVKHDKIWAMFDKYSIPAFERLWAVQAERVVELKLIA